MQNEIPDTPRTEDEIYRQWQTLRMPVGPLCTRQGDRITVMSPGTRNEGSGPDFRNGLILVNGTLRCGPIEMHLSERDWFAHGHDSDPAYDSVVLHVLGAHNRHAPLQLPHIPTVTIGDVLARSGPSVPRVFVTPHGVRRSDSRDAVRLLAELSWNRLLRRSTEIFRALPTRPTDLDFDRELGARLFDALGYSRNRTSMKALFELVWNVRDELAASSLRSLVERVYRLGEAVESGQEQSKRPCSSRPFNSPERRYLAAGILGYQLLCGCLRHGLLNELKSGSHADDLESSLEITAGRQILVGRPRAGDMVINAVLPLALAIGTVHHDPDLIAAACRTYRDYRSLQSNHVLRRVETRLGLVLGSSGAFLQQGALEYDRLYGSTDSARYTYVAEQTNPYSSTQRFA